jgi:hypothetical protein
MTTIGVDEERARPAGDRRPDRRVAELDPRVVDRCLVRAGGRFQGGGRGLRLIGLLLRDEALAGELGVALGVLARVVELGLAPREVRLGLAKLRLERSAVEGEEHLALPHVLSLAEMNAGHDAGHARPHGHGVGRLDVADRLELDRHRLLHRRCGHHRDRRRRCAPVFRGVAARAGGDEESGGDERREPARRTGSSHRHGPGGHGWGSNRSATTSPQCDHRPMSSTIRRRNRRARSPTVRRRQSDAATTHVLLQAVAPLYLRARCT